MQPKPRRDFKTSLWRPGWIGGSVCLGSAAFVGSLKDVFSWAEAVVLIMHAHPLLMVSGVAMSAIGNILYTDNRYHEQQRELEAIRSRPRKRRKRS